VKGTGFSPYIKAAESLGFTGLQKKAWLPVKSPKSIPQGLKPALVLSIYGTAEVVP
jgi:hypothetical protein